MELSFFRLKDHGRLPDEVGRKITPLGINTNSKILTLKSEYLERFHNQFLKWLRGNSYFIFSFWGKHGNRNSLLERLKNIQTREDTPPLNVADLRKGR